MAFINCINVVKVIFFHDSEITADEIPLNDLEGTFTTTPNNAAVA